MAYLFFLRQIFSSKPKLLINLWHLRSMNGMAYYSIDSLYDSLDKHDCLYIFRSSTIKHDYLAKADAELSSISFSAPTYFLVFLPALIVSSLFFRICIDCPTCHPLPFVRRQKIVVHDPYPFTSEILGIVRLPILFFSLLTSSTSIRYINKSSAFLFSAFLARFTLSEGLEYSPNRFPPLVRYVPPALGRGMFSIGLVGSASSKKNYTLLLHSFNALRLSNISFTVYGFETPYLASVKSHSSYHIEICNSASHDFADFFSSVNVIVNISLNEGFCRPVAAALNSGMPVYLLDCPVVREFYTASPAHIFDNVDEIVRNIVLRYDLS